MDVKCPGCLKITTVFSHAQMVVPCKGCSTILCTPTGGKARLKDGCSFRKKQPWAKLVCQPTEALEKVYKLKEPSRYLIITTVLLYIYNWWWSCRLNIKSHFIWSYITIELSSETDTRRFPLGSYLTPVTWLAWWPNVWIHSWLVISQIFTFLSDELYGVVGELGAQLAGYSIEVFS